MGKRIGLAVTVVAFAAAMTGCAAEDPGGGVASLSSAEPSAAVSATVAPEDRALKFAQCMREQGMSWFPDPEPGSRGFKMIIPKNVDKTKVDAAMAACKEFSPEGRSGVKLSPEDLERARQMAKCMRENGVPNFPDPGSDGRIKVDGRKLGLTGPDDPAFKAAEEACREFQPDGREPVRHGGTGGGGAVTG